MNIPPISHTAIFILLLLLCGPGESAGTTLTLRSRTAVDLELVGYEGLAEIPLFKGGIAAGKKQEVATPYAGLALLRFTGGQSYPVIIGDASFTLNIAGPAEPPAFIGSGENEFFSSRLAGNGPDGTGTPTDFARMLLQAKQLLESTYPIRTVPELTAKKAKIGAFVRDHYARLSHSDMVRRLVGQYFMMHEYVDYRAEGAPITAIKEKYQQAVLDGVAAWLEILRPHIPEHEVLNYSVSLYYDRSMVSLAALITDTFKDIAYCPGAEKKKWSFPDGLLVTDANKSVAKPFGSFRDRKIVSFVSDDCPVAMVQTVMRARQLVDQRNGEKLIVASVQELSDKHLAMKRMVSGGDMLFITDEQWRKENLAERVRLPLFVPVSEDVQE